MALEQLVRARLANRRRADLGTFHIDADPDSVTPSYIIGTVNQFRVVELDFMLSTTRQDDQADWEEQVDGRILALTARKRIASWYELSKEMSYTYGYSPDVNALAPKLLYKAARRVQDYLPQRVSLLMASYWIQVLLLEHASSPQAELMITDTLGRLILTDAAPYALTPAYITDHPGDDRPPPSELDLRYQHPLVTTPVPQYTDHFLEYNINTPFSTSGSRGYARVRVYLMPLNMLEIRHPNACVIHHFDEFEAVYSQTGVLSEMVLAFTMELINGRTGRVENQITSDRNVTTGDLSVDFALLRVCYYIARSANRVYRRMVSVTHDGPRALIEVQLFDGQGVIPCDPTGRLVRASAFHSLYEMYMRGITSRGRPVDITNDPGTFADFLRHIVESGVYAEL